MVTHFPLQSKPNNDVGTIACGPKARKLSWCVKAHTHWAVGDHADRLFDRSPVGMTDWNVQV